jgi:peroxiredoxin
LTTTDLNQPPPEIPIPQNDDSTKHLKRMKLPNFSLIATSGKTFNLGDIKGKFVIYCYPMTGQPNVALPDGCD